MRIPSPAQLLLGRSLGAIVAAVLSLCIAAPLFPAIVESFGRRSLTVDGTVRVPRGTNEVIIETEDTRVLGEKALQTVQLNASPDSQKKWTVEITADGSKNPQSSSSEVWIFGITTPEGAYPLKRAKLGKGQGWQRVKDARAQGGKLVVSTTSGEKSFKAVVTGSELSVFLLHHSFSGKINLSVNGSSQEIDLFAPHDGEIVRLDFDSNGKAITGEAPPTTRTITFTVPEPLTGRRTVKLHPRPNGAPAFESASIAGKPLTVANGVLELPKGKLTPASMRSLPPLLLFFSALFILLVLLPPAAALTPAGGIPGETAARTRWRAFALLLLSGIAFTLLTVGAQAVKFSALPLVIVSGIVAFSAELLPRRHWQILVGLVLFLQLKLPLMGPAALLWIHYLAAAAVMLLIIERIAAHHRDNGTIAPLLVSVLVIAGCALTHLSMLSPYSAVCVIAIWPDQYLTVLDGMVLNGDYPHFVDLFGSYSTNSHIPGMSVVLRRFFYEYVWSVLSPTHPAWAIAFAMNVMLWILSASAMISSAERLFRSQASIWFAALATGGLIIFTSYAAQPMLYLAAYAWAFILAGACLRVVAGPSGNATSQTFSWFFFFLSCAAIATYDLIPVIVPIVCLLAAARKWKMTGAIIAAQVALPIIWAQGVLLPLAGTLGPDSNRGFISTSIEKWRTALAAADVSTISSYLFTGAGNLFFASYGIGLLLMVCFLVKEGSKFRFRDLHSPEKTFVLLLTGAGLLINLAIAVLVAPELHYWSPGANLPRISAYYYPALLLAVCSFLKLRSARTGIGLGVAVAMVSFADTLGMYQPIMILQYGWWFGSY